MQIVTMEKLHYGVTTGTTDSNIGTNRRKQRIIRSTALEEFCDLDRLKNNTEVAQKKRKILNFHPVYHEHDNYFAVSDTVTIKNNKARSCIDQSIPVRVSSENDTDKVDITRKKNHDCDHSIISISSSSIQSEQDDDEIEVVEVNNTCKLFNTNTTINKDIEIQVVGVSSIAMPHSRRHCPDHVFPTNVTPASSSFINNNNTMIFTKPIKNSLQQVLSYCPTCYCYVCDLPVAECYSWPTHCFATETGLNKDYWIHQRQLVKQYRNGK
jgi:hypothetical protein